MDCKYSGWLKWACVRLTETDRVHLALSEETLVISVKLLLHIKAIRARISKNSARVRSARAHSQCTAAAGKYEYSNMMKNNDAHFLLRCEVMYNMVHFIWWIWWVWKLWYHRNEIIGSSLLTEDFRYGSLVKAAIFPENVGIRRYFATSYRCTFFVILAADAPLS